MAGFTHTLSNAGRTHIQTLCALEGKVVGVLTRIAAPSASGFADLEVELTACGSIALGTGVETRRETGLAAKVAGNALTTRSVGEVVVGTGVEARVVEVEEVDGTVGVGAVLGSYFTGNAGRTAGLTLVHLGRVDELTARTGLGTSVGSDVLVEDGKVRAVSAGLALCG